MHIRMPNTQKPHLNDPVRDLDLMRTGKELARKRAAEFERRYPGL